MVNCKKCKQYLSKSKGDTVQCKGSCEGLFHNSPACVGKKFAETGTCLECSSKSSPAVKPRIQLDTAQMNVESLLREVNDKMEVIYTMKQKIEEMSGLMEFYVEKYKEMVEFKKDCTERMMKCEDQITDLSHYSKYLEKKNTALEERVQFLENKNFEKRIEIVGVELQSNLNLRDVVSIMANKLKLNDGDILDVWKVGGENRTGEPKPKRPTILNVSLKSREARDKWLKCRKQRMTNSDFFQNNTDESIYINESVSKQTRELFWQTKTSLKGLFKFIWIQNSRVLIKKNEKEGKTIQIRKETDIQQYLETKIGE